MGGEALNRDLQPLQAAEERQGAPLGRGGGIGEAQVREAGEEAAEGDLGLSPADTGSGRDALSLSPTFSAGTRRGGLMSWVQRSTADSGTLWASTTRGRVFVSHNADAADPTAVSFTRIDTLDARELQRIGSLICTRSRSSGAGTEGAV